MSRLLAMQVFERVATEGGFSAAARTLDVSAPVVTRQVAQLEAHLGTRLFHRTTRRVTLTEAGRMYLGRVRQILQDIDEADAVASAHTNESVGRLRLHTQPVLASYVIAPLLSSFRQKHPGILVDIDVETHSELPIEDYDITLLGVDADFNATIVARKVIESVVILVASTAYIKRKGLPTKPFELAQHHCLRLRRPDRALRQWRMWPENEPERAIELDIDPVVVANHTDTLLRAALDGAGIMPISLDIAAPYLARGEMIRVLAPLITGRLAMYAALPSRQYVPRRTQLFLDYLIEHTRAQTARALQACNDLEAQHIS